MTMTMTHTDALESARDDRVLAERALRRSELERDHAARALEFDPAVRIDEAGRQRLRVAYADAAAAVETHRRAFDRAVAIEQAAQVLADALADETQPDHGIADGLLQLLEQRSRNRQRDTVPFSARPRRQSQDARAPQR